MMTYLQGYPEVGRCGMLLPPVHPLPLPALFMPTKSDGGDTSLPKIDRQYANETWVFRPFRNPAAT